MTQQRSSFELLEYTWLSVTALYYNTCSCCLRLCSAFGWSRTVPSLTSWSSNPETMPSTFFLCFSRNIEAVALEKRQTWEIPASNFCVLAFPSQTCYTALNTVQIWDVFPLEKYSKTNPVDCGLSLLCEPTCSHKGWWERWCHLSCHW